MSYIMDEIIISDSSTRSLHIFSSMTIIRWTGLPGVLKLSRRLSGSRSRCSCP